MPQRRVEPNGAEGSDLTSLFYTPLSMNCGIGRAILQMVPQPSVELKQLDSQLKRDLCLRAVGMLYLGPMVPRPER